MNTIFLSYHFDEEVRELANQLENLIDSHGLRTKTGARLGGAGLTPEVQRRIDDSDGVICLLTKRPDGRDNDWVMQEMQHAASPLQQPPKEVIAIVQKGLDRPTAMLAGRESLTYDPDNLAQLFLDVSATLGVWKRRHGRDLSILIEPEDAAAIAWEGDNVEVQFRCVDHRGQHSEWTSATLVPQAGGAMVYLQGVPDGKMLQVKMRGSNEIWESPFVQQSLRVELRRRGGAE